MQTNATSSPHFRSGASSLKNASPLYSASIQSHQSVKSHQSIQSHQSKASISSDYNKNIANTLSRDSIDLNLSEGHSYSISSCEDINIPYEKCTYSQKSNSKNKIKKSCKNKNTIENRNAKLNKLKDINDSNTLKSLEYESSTQPNTIKHKIHISTHKNIEQRNFILVEDRVRNWKDKIVSISHESNQTTKVAHEHAHVLSMDAKMKYYINVVKKYHSPPLNLDLE